MIYPLKFSSETCIPGSAPERPINSEILPEHADLRKKIAYHRDLAATAREELNFSEALDQLQQARQVCDELMDAAITKQVSQEYRVIQAEMKQKEQERQEQKHQEQERQEQKRQEQERQEQKRQEQERQEQKRQEQERQEQKRREQERQEQKRQAAELAQPVDFHGKQLIKAEVGVLQSP